MSQVVSRHTQLLPRIVSQCAAGGSQPISMPLLRHKGRPKPRYKPLYSDLPLARPRARCRSCRAFLSAVLQALPGRIVGVATRQPSRVVPPRPASQPCLSRYNALYRDSTLEWAVAHSRFLHSFFFFSLSYYWKTSKKFFFIFQ